MKAIHSLFACLALSCLSVPLCLAQTCKDSPLIPKFPGSTYRGCNDSKDDIGKFPMGDGKPMKQVEGELHFVAYRAPDGSSDAQLTRNLMTALKTAGYTVDWDGGHGNFTVHRGKTWIHEQVGSGGYEQTIVIEQALTQDMVATAADLSTGLGANGHAVVNGILFDTAKSDVKPESSAALDEVVKLLKQDAKLKLYVVGHTDNVGPLAANMELSKQRAASVVKELTTKYGIAADRLAPFGDGPYAPVTSNDSADGRTLNRRVELVKQ